MLFQLWPFQVVKHWFIEGKVSDFSHKTCCASTVIHIRYFRGQSASPHCSKTRVYQVWSLTQIYSVDFLKSKIDVQKCVFKKRTIKVCVSCCWRCPGTSVPSAEHMTTSLYLCSSGSNARGESRAREGRRVSSKSPSRVRDGDEGVAGRNGRK